MPVEAIIENATTYLPDSLEINESKVVEFIWFALHEIGTPSVLLEQRVFLPVQNHIAVMPGRLHSVANVSYVHDKPEDFREPSKFNSVRLQMTTSKDIDYLDEDMYGRHLGYKYRLEDGRIITSFPEGVIELVFSGYPVDKYNKPLVIKSPIVITAVTLYVVSRILRKAAVNKTSIFELFRQTERDANVAILQARSSLLLPTTDEMQEMYDKYTRILPIDQNRLPLYGNSSNLPIMTTEEFDAYRQCLNT